MRISYLTDVDQVAPNRRSAFPGGTFIIEPGRITKMRHHAVTGYPVNKMSIIVNKGRQGAVNVLKSPRHPHRLTPVAGVGLITPGHVQGTCTIRCL